LFDYACLRYKIGFYKNIKVFMREKDEQDFSWDGLVVVCADNFEYSEEMKGQVGIDIKQYMGIPKEIPLIRFSQILMNIAVKNTSS